MSAVNGQVQQGTVPVGGGFAIKSTAAEKDYESRFYNFSPYSGYFFTDNFGITAGISYAKALVEISNYPIEGELIKIQQETFNTFIGARHYFYAGDYRFFGQIDINSSTLYTETSTSISNSKNSWTDMSAKIGLGANVFFNSNVCLEGTLKYTPFMYNGRTDHVSTFDGSLDFVIDVRPYLVETGDLSSSLADEFLDYGTMVVGGSTGFRNNFENHLSLWLSPRIGFFPVKGLLLGMEGSISYTDNRTSKPVAFGAAPFLRYYLRATDALQIVPNFVFTYRHTQYRGNILGVGNDATQYEVIPGLGLHLFVAEGLGLFGNGSLIMSRQPGAEDIIVDPSKTTSFQFVLGLEYYINSGYW